MILSILIGIALQNSVGTPKIARPGGLELPSNETVRAAVAAGAGIAIVSRLVVADALKAGSLVELGFRLPNRGFYALRHKEYSPTRAARAFLEMIS